MYLPLTRRDFAQPPAGGMTIMVRSDAGTDALAESGARSRPSIRIWPCSTFVRSPNIWI